MFFQKHSADKLNGKDRKHINESTDKTTASLDEAGDGKNNGSTAVYEKHDGGGSCFEAEITVPQREQGRKSNLYKQSGESAKGKIFKKCICFLSFQ